LFTCICDNSNCATACASSDCSTNPDAAPSNPGDPCDKCEQKVAPDDGGGACGPPVKTACDNSLDCLALDNCLGNCPQ
jgi:hypothetical protein